MSSQSPCRAKERALALAREHHASLIVSAVNGKRSYRANCFFVHVPKQKRSVLASTCKGEDAAFLRALGFMEEKLKL